MIKNKIAIIGGGKMGSAIARGFVRQGIATDKIVLAQRNAKKRKFLQKEGFEAYEQIIDYSGVDLIIIAVKPKDTFEVLRAIKYEAEKSTIVVSTVSGMTCETIRKVLGYEYPLFRIKPSIFVEIGQGVIPICPCSSQEKENLNVVNSLFNLLGTTYIMSETMMEMSAWDFSSLPAIIISKIIQERLDHVSPGNKQLVANMIISGLKSTISYFAEQQEKPLTEVIDLLCKKVATPGGNNDAAISYLEEQRFWQLSSEAREVYEKRIKDTNNKIAKTIIM